MRGAWQGFLKGELELALAYRKTLASWTTSLPGKRPFKADKGPGTWRNLICIARSNVDSWRFNLGRIGKEILASDTFHGGYAPRS